MVVRSLLYRLLQSAGLETVSRIMRAYPTRSKIIQQIGIKYPTLSHLERTVLYNLGSAAVSAAELLTGMPPESVFPIDDIPLVEHLGLDPSDFDRGRISIEGIPLTDEWNRPGGWSFYMDHDLTGTVGEMMEQARSELRDIMEREAAYDPRFTIPEHFEVKISFSWIARIF